MLKRFSFFFLLTLLGGLRLAAQATIPTISGGLQFASTTSGGVTTMQPVIQPVVLIPMGERWLIESRGSFTEFIFRENGDSGPYHAKTFSSLDYVQLDFLADPHLTISVGRFLLPFGMFNERLTPIWLRNFQDVPIILAIGNLTTASGDG